MKTITKDKLEKLYRENSNKYVCKILGITKATLVSILIKSNIPLKGKGNRNKKSKINVI